MLLVALAEDDALNVASAETLALDPLDGTGVGVNPLDVEDDEDCAKTVAIGASKKMSAREETMSVRLTFSCSLLQGYDGSQNRECLATLTLTRKTSERLCAGHKDAAREINECYGQALPWVARMGAGWLWASCGVRENGRLPTDASCWPSSTTTATTATVYCKPACGLLVCLGI